MSVRLCILLLFAYNSLVSFILLDIHTAVRPLTLSPAETKAGAFSAGGLQSVLDLLNHANAGVRKMASWIANNMVVDGSVNDDVRRLGGIAPMVKLLSEADPFVKEQAVTVLANLAVNETNLDPLRDAGGLKGLLAVAAAKESSDNLRLKAVWALSNAVVSDENQVAFQDLGGIKFLMHFLANPNVKVQVRAAAACVNLTQSSDPCRAEIGASGGVARLVQCLAVNAPELEEHAMKAFVNLSLCAANEVRFSFYLSFSISVGFLFGSSTTFGAVITDVRCTNRTGS